MTNRTPPPLPTAQAAKPEQPAETKPSAMDQIQKTIGDVATCIKGVSQLVGFVEKHLGTGPAKPSAFPANMPPLPTMGNLAMNPMPEAFPGFPMPDMGMAMNPMFGGFPMPDMGMGFDPNQMMGMGFDPNLMMGMGFDQM